VLSQPVFVDVGFSPQFVNPEDLDNDKDVDVIVGSATTSGMSILQNNGTGSMNASPVPMAGEQHRIATADLDGDGDPEMMVAMSDETLNDDVVRVFRNDTVDGGGGQIVFAQGDDLAVSPDTRIVLAGDVDGDGQQDVVTINDATGLRAMAGGNGSAGRDGRNGGRAGGGGRGPAENTVSMLKNEDEPNPCPADVMPQPRGDGQVTIADITFVLSAFGLPCDDCPQDFVPQPDGDNQVSIADINAVLAAFGPCAP
jgi:hypothetical protein